MTRNTNRTKSEEGRIQICSFVILELHSAEELPCLCETKFYSFTLPDSSSIRPEPEICLQAAVGPTL